MDLAGVLGTLCYVIEVIIGVGLIIFVHELGHFLAAKWAGVKVKRFFFGFAPTIAIGRKKIKLQFFAVRMGETLYGLGMLPFGGFVDMAGEQEGMSNDPGIPDERKFNTKTAGQRAVIFAAGAAMNAVSAVLFFILAFAIGVSFVRPIVGDVAKGLPAWQAGIEPADTIVAVDGKKYGEFSEMYMAIALADPGSTLDITVKRDGETFNTRVKPILDPQGRGMSIGISPSYEPAVGGIQESSPMQKAGLRAGDRILSISYTDPQTGERLTSKVRNHLDISRIVTKGEFIGQPLVFEVQRAESQATESVTVVPEISPQTHKIIGVSQYATKVIAIRRAPTVESPLKAGSVFQSIGGERFYSLEALSKDLFTLKSLKVKLADGSEFDVEGAALRKWLEDDIALVPPTEEPVIGYVHAGMPAALAGLRPGDRVVEVEGHPVETFTEFALAIRKKPGGPVQIKWLREKPGGGKQLHSASLTPAHQRKGYVGIIYRQDRFILRERSLFGAIGTGFKRTVLWGKRVFLVLKSLFTRTVSAQNLAGPVGIFTISYAVTQYGVGTLLYFLALISINLAIINIFPIPVLDGGHLLFLLIEKIKGSPVALKTQVIAQSVGLVLLLSLAVFVTYNDILRLVTGF